MVRCTVPRRSVLACNLVKSYCRLHLGSALKDTTFLELTKFQQFSVQSYLLAVAPGCRWSPCCVPSLIMAVPCQSPMLSTALLAFGSPPHSRRCGSSKAHGGPLLVCSRQPTHWVVGLYGKSQETSATAELISWAFCLLSDAWLLYLQKVLTRAERWPLGTSMPMRPCLGAKPVKSGH